MRSGNVVESSGMYITIVGEEGERVRGGKRRWRKARGKEQGGREERGREGDT